MSKNDKRNEAVEAEGTESPKRSKSEQLARYKERYVPYETATGVSMDNGDDIALILRGAAPEVVVRAAEKLKQLEPGTLAERYADRNPGAKRMNAGNIIRGFERRGDATVAEIKKVIKAANAEINTAS